MLISLHNYADLKPTESIFEEDKITLQYFKIIFAFSIAYCRGQRFFIGE